MEKILLIGLGNPGMDATRHNIGIEALRSWFGTDMHWHEDTKVHGEVAKMMRGGKQIYGLFPLTYMNESGKAVVEFLRHVPVAPEHILVIHDELELPLGEVRLDMTGGSARGHNGVRSIHTVLGLNTMPRLRLGIGRSVDGQMPVEKFVLGKFRPEEQEMVAAMISKAGEQISEFMGSR